MQRAAECIEGLVLYRLLERVALEIVHQREVIRMSGIEPSRAALAASIVDELPVLPAHRGELGAGVVEEEVARRMSVLPVSEVRLVDAVERGLDEARIRPRLDLLLQAIARRASGQLDVTSAPNRARR